MYHMNSGAMYRYAGIPRVTAWLWYQAMYHYRKSAHENLYHKIHKRGKMCLYVTCKAYSTISFELYFFSPSGWMT